MERVQSELFSAFWEDAGLDWSTSVKARHLEPAAPHSGAASFRLRLLAEVPLTAGGPSLPFKLLFNILFISSNVCG